MICCVATVKGGDGKTTTSLMISSILALSGKKVLCIDLDIQNSLSFALGIKYEDCLTENITTFINSEKINPFKISIGNINLDLIPSTFKLSSMRTISLPHFKNVLYKSGVVDNYDYIVIDTSPSYDNFFLTASFASDVIIYPICARSVFSQKCLFDTIEFLSVDCPTALDKIYLLPTFYESLKDEDKVINYIISKYGDNSVLKPIKFSNKYQYINDSLSYLAKKSFSNVLEDYYNSFSSLFSLNSNFLKRNKENNNENTYYEDNERDTFDEDNDN